MELKASLINIVDLCNQNNVNIVGIKFPKTKIFYDQICCPNI